MIISITQKQINNTYQTYVFPLSSKDQILEFVKAVIYAFPTTSLHKGFVTLEREERDTLVIISGDSENYSVHLQRQVISLHKRKMEVFH